MSDHEGLVQDQLLYIESLEAERDALAEKLARAEKRLTDGHYAPVGWVSGDRYEMASREKMDYRSRWLEEREAAMGLAATVERWHSVYVDLTNSMMMFDGVAHYVADNAMMRRFDEIDESSPTTSLARLKAEWQAEALDWAYNQVVTPYSGAPLTLETRAIELRRQAEEPSA